MRFMSKKILLSTTALVTAALCCFAGTCPPAASAHKFYTSFAHLEFNAETKSLEVTARIFADDLEVILTKKNGKAVYLDSTKDVDKLVLSYLQGSFQLKGADGHVRPVEWVGMETKVDTAWVYFEIKLPEGLAGAELRDSILFDLFEEQVNLASFKEADKKAELVFRRGDDFKAISIS